MSKKNTLPEVDTNKVMKTAEGTDAKPPVVSNKREHKLNIKPIGEQEYEVVRFDNPELIQRIEEEYPAMTTEFKRIIFTQYELFCMKQDNYGPDNIAAGTKLATDEDVKLSLTGLFFRINDKVQRIKNLIVLGKKDNVGEAVDDTFMDLSVYGIIAQIVKNGKWGK